MVDARTYLPLSPQQFQILLALSDEDRHGYGIILEVRSRTGGAVRLGTGTLYTALGGLVDDTLIDEAAAPPSAAGTVRDPRRKYYRITPLGRRVVEAETARLDALVRDARRKGIRPAARPAWSRPK
jgi:DNA-binding PadR family transcriptional regulator